MQCSAVCRLWNSSCEGYAGSPYRGTDLPELRILTHLPPTVIPNTGRSLVPSCSRDTSASASDWDNTPLLRTSVYYYLPQLVTITTGVNLASLLNHQYLAPLYPQPKASSLT